MNRTVFEVIELVARFNEEQREEFCHELTIRYPGLNEELTNLFLMEERERKNNESKYN